MSGAHQPTTTGTCKCGPPGEGAERQDERGGGSQEAQVLGHAPAAAAAAGTRSCIKTPRDEAVPHALHDGVRRVLRDKDNSAQAVRVLAAGPRAGGGTPAGCPRTAEALADHTEGVSGGYRIYREERGEGVCVVSERLGPPGCRSRGTWAAG